MKDLIEKMNRNEDFWMGVISAISFLLFAFGTVGVIILAK
jgi:hypothetical protein